MNIKTFVIFLIVFVALILGCYIIKNEKKVVNNVVTIGENKVFYSVIDGKKVFFIYDVPYVENDKSTKVRNELESETIILQDFINEFELQDSLWDGGSKIYKYNPQLKKYGNEEFYVLVCNTVDGVNDIYIESQINRLEGLCVIR